MIHHKFIKCLKILCITSIFFAFNNISIAGENTDSSIDEGLEEDKLDESNLNIGNGDIDSLVDEITDEYYQTMVEKNTPDNKDKELSENTEETDLLENDDNSVPDDADSDGIKLHEFQSDHFVKIILLNKITSKSQNLEFNVGKIHNVGNISITAHKCVKNTDPFNVNSFVLFTVTDKNPQGEDYIVYHGWLASSNLSIATVEHPVYEIMVTDCVKLAPKEF